MSQSSIRSVGLSPSESTHEWLLWTCWCAVTCPTARVACLSPLLQLLPLVLLHQKSLGWLGAPRGCPSLFPHCLLWFVTDAWNPDAEAFSCKDSAALPPPGQKANTPEQAAVEAWEALHVSSQLACSKEVEVSKKISVSVVKMIVAWRDWGLPKPK